MNNSFRNIFQIISSIHVLYGLDGDVNIDSDLNESVIFKNSYYHNNEESVYDNIAFFDGKRYELRLITCVIQLPAAMEYYTHIYNRHGGCHTKWWYQERNKTFSITIQVEHLPILKANAEHMAVYNICQINALLDVSK